MAKDEDIEESLLEQVTSHDGPRESIIQDIQDRNALRELRDNYSNFIKRLLSIELLFAAILLLFQGFKVKDFQINNCLFGLFLAGIIGQTFFLMRGIVTNIFPKNK